MRAIEIELNNGGSLKKTSNRRYISSSGANIVVNGTSKAKNEYLRELLGMNKEEIALRQKRILSLPAVRRGIEMESVAASHFELDTGVKLRKCGFFIHPDIPLVGGSPDRISVCEQYGLEIKCPSSLESHEVSSKIGIPQGYYWQCTFLAWLLGFKFWYFYSWYPNSENKVRKVTPTSVEIKKLENAIDEFHYMLVKRKFYPESDRKDKIALLLNGKTDDLTYFESKYKKEKEL